jgi:cytochrome P450
VPTVTDKPTIDELHESLKRDYPVYRQGTIAEHLAELADRREKCPISFSSDGGFWVLSTYDDISSVLRRNNRGFISFPNMPDGTQAFGQKMMKPIEIDGSEHRQYRKILEPLFAPARITAIEPRIRQVASDLIDQFIGAGTCDFVEQFAMPFPGTTFLAMMGWPLADAATLNGYSGVMLHGVPGAPQEEIDAARGAAAVAFQAYIADQIAQRRAEPTDDVTTAVINAEIDGALIPDSDLYDVFVLMMMAGLDTVQSVLAQSMIYLAQHPDQWQEMFRRPEHIDAAVEELLRWTSPAVPTRNVSDESAAVGDLELPKGERVHCPLGAGNRDPKYFPEPDEVRFERDPKPHLTFGMGPHRCLGVHLARAELRIAFEELHRRLPAFTLAPGTEPAEHLGLTWGVDNVKLAFEPGPREG